MTQNKGASPLATGLSSASPIEPLRVSPAPASIPCADDWCDLSTKTPLQIANVIAAFGPLIAHYSKSVSSLEQQIMDVESRHLKDRDFLAKLMADYLRLTHFVARQAASALENTSEAQAIEARRAATTSGAVHESAVGETDAPNLGEDHDQ